MVGFRQDSLLHIHPCDKLAISGADEETVAKLLSPLQDAEAKAARKKASVGRGPAALDVTPETAQEPSEGDG